MGHWLFYYRHRRPFSGQIAPEVKGRQMSAAIKQQTSDFSFSQATLFKALYTS